LIARRLSPNCCRNNAAVIANTNQQADADRDGLGDACDPAGSNDDDGDGAPDDLARYNVSVACRALPLAKLVVRLVRAGDVDGDHDVWIDAGEKGRIYVEILNAGTTDLTNVTFNLNSADPDVACITQPSIRRSVFPAGQSLVLGSIGADKIAGTGDDTGDYFEVVAKSTLASTSGSNPARLDFLLTLTSSETGP